MGACIPDEAGSVGFSFAVSFRLFFMTFVSSFKTNNQECGSCILDISHKNYARNGRKSHNRLNHKGLTTHKKLMTEIDFQARTN